MIIALTSDAMGAGKSEVAKHLVSEGYSLLKFAGPMKAMIRALLGDIGIDTDLIERYVEGDLKEAVIPELGVTCRRLMQTLGTEWGRDCIHEDLWVHLMKVKVPQYDKVIIDDLRFENEMIAVEDLGGTCARVVRPGAADTTGHVSEGALSKYEMSVILNDGSLDDLSRSVAELVDRLV